MKKVSTMFGLMLFITLFQMGYAQSLEPSSEYHTLPFEKTDYGLIFTSIQVDGEEVKAMIDLGDQHVLQLSSTLTKRLGLKTEKAGYQVGDVYGNVWDVYQGTVPELRVGSWQENKVPFTSQPGEMEAVSQQIGTEFHAVLGWGYFKNFYTELDYAHDRFLLHSDAPLMARESFQLPYSQDAGQLIVPATIKGKSHKLMIDTGSPVTVVDSGFYQNLPENLFQFTLSEQSLELPAYPQDLSILSDLGVVAILGGDFLKQWKIVIDPKETLLHFQKVED